MKKPKYTLSISLNERGVSMLKQMNVPEYFLEFASRANGGSPSVSCLHHNGRSLSINNIVDFNKYKKEHFGYLGEREIVFLDDGFGNYYLFNIENCDVSFYEYRSGEKTRLMSFVDFELILDGENG